MIAYYDSTGRITHCAVAPFSEAAANARTGESYIEVGDEVTDLTHYVENGAIVPFPARPSRFHDWNWTTKAWEPNVEAAKAKRRADVDRAMVAATLAPIDYDGSPFDADETARSRISGTIARLARGDGLPAGWLGWRDAENAQHWANDLPLAVEAHLHALSTAIEDREQALLIAAWTHKAAIDALTTVEDVLAYDVSMS